MLIFDGIVDNRTIAYLRAVKDIKTQEYHVNRGDWTQTYYSNYAWSKLNAASKVPYKPRGGNDLTALIYLGMSEQLRISMEMVAMYVSFLPGDEVVDIAFLILDCIKYDGSDEMKTQIALDIAALVVGGAFRYLDEAILYADEAVYYSNKMKYMSQATNSVDEFVGFSGSAAEIYRKYAIEATVNSSSDIVVLGKFYRTGLSYDDVAEALKATYFNLPNWDEVEALLGKQNMWNINAKFLYDQILQDKTFILTHNPNKATGSFLKECQMLVFYGYEFVRDGDFWKAVKR